MLWNTDRLGESTTSLGSLFQFLITLSAKKCFLILTELYKLGAVQRFKCSDMLTHLLALKYNFKDIPSKCKRFKEIIANSKKYEHRNVSGQNTATSSAACLGFLTSGERQFGAQQRFSTWRTEMPLPLYLSYTERKDNILKVIWAL